MGVLSAAPVFHAASQNAVPFRRDRLPVDADRMHEMAGYLTVLASGVAKARGPKQLRAAAQLLALAKALDPDCAEIGAMEQMLSKGAASGAPDSKGMGRARHHAWEYWNWLGRKQAGRDARVFAACLGDALAVATPEHPHADELRKTGEKGPWKGWVADLDAFHSAPDLPVVPPEKNGEEPERDEDPAPPEEPAVVIRLKKASVRVPFEYKKYFPRAPGAEKAPPSELRFGAFPVAIKAWSKIPKPEASEKDGTVVEAPSPVSEYLLTDFIDEKDKAAIASLHATMTEIRAVLSARHGGLPPGGRASFTFNSSRFYDWKRNRDAAAGAVALLMDASLAGRAPDPGAVVFAGIGPEGRLRLPWRPWDKIRRIADDPDIPGGRFVLPREARPLLDGLLVIEKPEFFLRYEVLLAEDLEGLSACAAGEPEDGLASAMEKFAAIRTAAKGKQIGPFLVNRFVRQRLAEVLEEFPGHASARMLLAQGGGNRPTQYSTDILAREIRMALKPMEWIAKLKPDSRMTGVEDDELDAAWKVCRERLDPLKSRVTRDDLKFFDRAFDLVQSIRTFSNALQRYRKAVRQKPDSSYSASRKSAELYRALAKDYAELMKKIGILVGEVASNAGNAPENPDASGASLKHDAP
jgi:hypothetical protein